MALEATDQDVLDGRTIDLISRLQVRFGPTRDALLGARSDRQDALDAGATFAFRSDTADLRADAWTIDPIPADLADRRVEITGPPDPKLVLHALNSGARCFMADFEDALAPTWPNVLAGHRAVAAAARGTLSWSDPAGDRRITLGDRPATLLVRPRGWHLVEAHVRIEDRPVSASLFDFAVAFSHLIRERRACGRAPYFYLPKLESAAEAALWDDVFTEAERWADLPVGTIKATVLIETLPAAFEMDEILHALRRHVVGLNCGRWDYIFSYIKKNRRHPRSVLPDRGLVGMNQPFLRAYTRLAIQTCHRRGAHCLGGMAAQIPLKDPDADAQARARVRADKEREVGDGHDGTWVAHPALVPLATEIFDRGMPGPDQRHRRPDGAVTAADLLTPPVGPRTEAGLRHNVRVGVRYLEAWLGGVGCVPLHGLMEDAATAEISRAQVWAWRVHGADVDGAPLTEARLRRVLGEERAALVAERASETLNPAFDLFSELVLDDGFTEFLTLPAYARANPELR